MKMSSKIAFPGLGIGEFEIDRVAFEIFGRPVAWYGLIIAIGMMTAIGYVMLRTRNYKGIKPDDVVDFALFIIVFGVIGARLYYVITDGGYDSFAEIIAIWEGGLAIYGGIIAGGLAALGVCYFKKIRPQCLCDMLGPAVMLAQAIGRWGNFCNGEAFGSETGIFIRMQLTNALTGHQTVCVHPTFLYESLWNIIGFILLNIFYNRRKFDGQIVLGYFAWYGFGRMFIEGLRTDSLYVGPFRISQVVGLVSFIAATAVMIYVLVSGKGKRIYESASYKAEKVEKEEEYTPVIISEESADGDAQTEDDAVSIAPVTSQTEKTEEKGE
jgi:phosphatidylglycerol:prolipoprotein diacylglycerol transferase